MRWFAGSDGHHNRRKTTEFALITDGVIPASIAFVSAAVTTNILISDEATSVKVIASGVALGVPLFYAGIHTLTNSLSGWETPLNHAKSYAVGFLGGAFLVAKGCSADAATVEHVILNRPQIETSQNYDLA